jgi:hypothetical protein
VSPTTGEFHFYFGERVPYGHYTINALKADFTGSTSTFEHGLGTFDLAYAVWDTVTGAHQFAAAQTFSADEFQVPGLQENSVVSVVALDSYQVLTGTSSTQMITTGAGTKNLIVSLHSTILLTGMTIHYQPLAAYEFLDEDFFNLHTANPLPYARWTVAWKPVQGTSINYFYYHKVGEDLLTAENPYDTIEYIAGPGIILEASTEADTITISAISPTPQEIPTYVQPTPMATPTPFVYASPTPAFTATPQEIPTYAQPTPQPTLAITSSDGSIDITPVSGGYNLLVVTPTPQSIGGGGDDNIWLPTPDPDGNEWRNEEPNYAYAPISFYAALFGYYGTEDWVANLEPLIILDQWTQIQRADQTVSHGWRITNQAGMIIEVNSDSGNPSDDVLVVTNGDPAAGPVNGTKEQFRTGDGGETWSKAPYNTDLGYQVNSVEGRSGTVSFTDNSSQTHSITVTGGIITSWKINSAEQLAVPTP